MGLSGVSVWELLLILVVLLLLFGSKRLPGIASDLGAAIRDFRRSFSAADTFPPAETSGPAGDLGHDLSSKRAD